MPRDHVGHHLPGLERRSRHVVPSGSSLVVEPLEHCATVLGPAGMRIFAAKLADRIRGGEWTDAVKWWADRAWPKPKILAIDARVATDGIRNDVPTVPTNAERDAAVARMIGRASQYNDAPDYRAWLRERNPIAAAELDVAMALDADVEVIDAEVVTTPARLESGAPPESWPEQRL